MTEPETVVLLRARSSDDTEAALAKIETARDLGRIPRWLVFVFIGPEFEVTVLTAPDRRSVVDLTT